MARERTTRELWSVLWLILTTVIFLESALDRATLLR